MTEIDTRLMIQLMLFRKNRYEADDPINVLQEDRRSSYVTVILAVYVDGIARRASRFSTHHLSLDFLPQDFGKHRYFQKCLLVWKSHMPRVTCHLGYKGLIRLLLHVVVWRLLKMHYVY